MTRTGKPATHQLAPRVLGAALALGVAYAHVKDQGGFPGDKEPGYVGVGYYLLELAGLGVALALLAGGSHGGVAGTAVSRQLRKVWALTLGVAVGPILGFVLSRGPGLPNYSDDKGNWSEPLAVASLIIEGLLLLIAAGVLLHTARTVRTIRTARTARTAR